MLTFFVPKIVLLNVVCKKDFEFCRVRNHRLLHYGERVLTTQKNAINSAAPLSQKNHEHDGPYDQSKCSFSELSLSIEEPVLNKVHGLGRDLSLLFLPPEVDSLAFVKVARVNYPVIVVYYWTQIHQEY